LEYQGEGHYFQIPVYGGMERRKLIDDFKAKASKNMGVTLIPIPYWWDNKPASLAATLQRYRPGNRSHSIAIYRLVRY
jgi:hypothetical protein